MNYSQTQLANFGTAAGLIVFLLSQFGIVFPADKLTYIIACVWCLGTTGYNFWNRYSKGDITLSGAKI